eukprot:jgi/Psemu1/60717/gm1.60717_g
MIDKGKKEMPLLQEARKDNRGADAVLWYAPPEPERMTSGEKARLDCREACHNAVSACLNIASDQTYVVRIVEAMTNGHENGLNHIWLDVDGVKDST